MQTPSTPAGSPLELAGPEGEDGDENEGVGIGPGDSMQKILRFELKEEGNHVLAVTVTYTETTLAGEGKAASGRVRTFRKLYQFVAQQLLGVRTKVGELSADGKVLLEAQLENVGEAAVCFDVSLLSVCCCDEGLGLRRLVPSSRACNRAISNRVKRLTYGWHQRPIEHAQRACSVLVFRLHPLLFASSIAESPVERNFADQPPLARHSAA